MTDEASLEAEFDMDEIAAEAPPMASRQSPKLTRSVNIVKVTGQRGMFASKKSERK